MKWDRRKQGREGKNLEKGKRQGKDFMKIADRATDYQPNNQYLRKATDTSALGGI